MKSKLSCYCDNVHVTIYFKSCILYFLSVDSDLDLRVNALLLEEFLECRYVHMYLNALLVFWKPYGKHSFQNSFYDPSDVLSDQALSVHKKK